MSDQDWKRLLNDPYFATLNYVFDTARKFFNWTHEQKDEAYRHIAHTWFTETKGFNDLSQKEQMLLVTMSMAKTLSALMETSRHIPNRTIEKLVF